MTISKLVLEVDDVEAATVLHQALGVTDLVGVRPATAAATGFRGFTLSLVCSQPADVDALLDAAVAAGARVLKPGAKSFWGYGGVVQAPDGTVWKLAASSKKNTSPGAARFDDLVLLLGVRDVKTSKQFYLDAGLVVTKSFGGRYAELESSPVSLALYPRRAAARDAGVPEEGTGSHRLVVLGAVALTDPDGFTWEVSRGPDPGAARNLAGMTDVGSLPPR